MNEHYFALLADLGVSNIVAGKDAQPFKEWLVGESTLEARSGILNQTVQDDQGADLTVRITVLTGEPLVVIPLASRGIPTAFSG